MKEKEKLTPHIISVIAFVVFIVLGLACASSEPTSAPAQKKETQAEREAREAEAEKLFAEARQKREQEAAADRARGYINIDSDTAGAILLNGNETGRNVTMGVNQFTVDNANGTYTVAVRDSAGTLVQATPINIDKTGPENFYTVVIRNTQPNAQEDFDVTQNAQGGITITKYKGTRRNIIIPQTLYGQKVTAIGDSAFREKGIVSVVIPNSIVTIGRSAFSSNNINEVLIPNSVTSIGKYAFQSNGLTKVTIGRGVRFIDDDAFAKGYGAGVNDISELIVLAPLTEYDRRKTGIEWNSIVKVYVDTYSQTLGLNPEVFGSGRGSSLQSLRRVTLPANIHDGNLEAFPEGLVGFYKSQGKRAGIYVLNGPVWTRE